MGAQQGGERRCTRDVLVKLNYFKAKQAILQAARKKNEVSFQGFHCNLFQDLAPATLLRRQQFRPITTKLREDNIKYKWTFPFGLAFELNNKTKNVTKLKDGLRLLGLPSTAEDHAALLQRGKTLRTPHGGERAQMEGSQKTRVCTTMSFVMIKDPLCCMQAHTNTSGAIGERFTSKSPMLSGSMVIARLNMISSLSVTTECLGIAMYM